jgi:hypothetical protein
MRRTEACAVNRKLFLRVGDVAVTYRALDAEDMPRSRIARCITNAASFLTFGASVVATYNVASSCQ